MPDSPYLRHLRNSRWGSPSISHGSKEGLCRFLLSASLHNCLIALVYIRTYSKYSCSSYLSWMSLQTQLLGYPLFNKCARSSCFSWLSFIIVIFQSHLGAEASWLPSCTKILLTVRTRPADIALNYSVKNIRNDVRQIILYEKSRFNSLVWGSLTLAQLLTHKSRAWNLRNNFQ